MLIINLIVFIRDFMKKMKEDYVSSFSAQAAFFIILSFFPFVMFLLTLIQYLPLTESQLMGIIRNIVPDTFNALIVSIISEIFDKASGTLISITVITALWSASKGFIAIITGLNCVYGELETRNYIVLRIVASIYTVVFALMLIATLVVLGFGNKLFLWITSIFPFLNDVALVIISLRAGIGLGVLILFFCVMYTYIPNRKTKFWHELPGAFMTACGWMGFSYLFSFYIDNMANFSYMYGSLTAIVLLMLWIYACMYMMFIGAEVNCVLNQNEGFIKWRNERKKT